MEQHSRYDYHCAACGTNGEIFLPEGPNEGGPVCASCREPVVFTPPWFAPRPLYTDEDRLQWFYESLAPEKWCKPGATVSAREAALMLCCYNPDWGKREDGTRDPLAGVVDASMTDHHARLLERFERLETAQPTVGRTLAQWRDLARVERFLYDSRIDGLLPPFGASQDAMGRLDARPKTQSQQQEDAILQVIGTLGYTADALPKAEPGKSGVKAEVRAMLPYSRDAFDKAWVRLRKEGRITDAV